MAIKASDQISIVDVTDAYSVILTSEAFTFVGGTDGVAAGATCSTQVVAYCGTNQCEIVNVNKDNITLPTDSKGNKQMSVVVEGSGSKVVTITFTTTSEISNACEATIPVSVDGIVINKKFSFAVAKAGQKGDQGPQGEQGIQGPQGEQGIQGPQGNAGADAITMSITSSNGTVFKNNSDSTLLTAHVYKAGVEQTIADNGVCGSLGSVKWYEGTSTASLATAKTLTVSAADVTNAVAYTCQLEEA